MKTSEPPPSDINAASNAAIAASGTSKIGPVSLGSDAESSDCNNEGDDASSGSSDGSDDTDDDEKQPEATTTTAIARPNATPASPPNGAPEPKATPAIAGTKEEQKVKPSEDRGPSNAQLPSDAKIRNEDALPKRRTVKTRTHIVNKKQVTGPHVEEQTDRYKSNSHHGRNYTTRPRKRSRSRPRHNGRSLSPRRDPPTWRRPRGRPNA